MPPSLVRSHGVFRSSVLLFGLAGALTSCISAVAQIAPAKPDSGKLFSVDQFGAKGDGFTKDTLAIQRTIDAAASSGQTHTTVIFPSGSYLTGAIFVKNGVTLRIDKGVTLRGSQQLADYPVLPTRVAGIEMVWPAALVNVYRQHGASITGEGVIDGDGKIYWESYWDLRKTYEPRGLRWASDYDAQRPRLIQVFDSQNVQIGGGLTLRRAGFWTVHICYSENIVVDGVVIRNNEDGHGPSTDGIDIDSSKKVVVQHADISVNDDALCLKAGRDSDGLRVGRPSENIILRDSIIRAGAAGVTFGSETSGGFRNVEAYNLTVLGPVPVGILFKSAHTRGGFAEDIKIHDLNLTDVSVVLRVILNWNPSYSYASIPSDITSYPSYWKTLATPVPANQGIAHIRDVHLSNITAVGAKTAFEVSAYPQAPLEDFTLSNLKIQAKNAGFINNAKDWSFSNTNLVTSDGSVVTLYDDTAVTGIPSRQGHANPSVDTSKTSFAEQDKN